MSKLSLGIVEACFSRLEIACCFAAAWRCKNERMKLESPLVPVEIRA